MYSSMTFACLGNCVKTACGVQIASDCVGTGVVTLCVRECDLSVKITNFNILLWSHAMRLINKVCL